MRKIEKHSFEAVSLLTVDNGLLDLTVIPAIGQPDWVIPSSLILSVNDYDEHIWTYLWNNQEVSVYHLLPRDEKPDKVIVLEGNTDVHRIGLLVKGALELKQVNISDVKDTALPSGFVALNNHSDPTEADESIEDITDDTSDTSVSQDKPVMDEQSSIADENTSADKENNTVLPYAFQAVEIDNEVYLVPDLDTLAHHLVDLDSY